MYPPPPILLAAALRGRPAAVFRAARARMGFRFIITGSRRVKRLFAYQPDTWSAPSALPSCAGALSCCAAEPSMGSSSTVPVLSSKR